MIPQLTEAQKANFWAKVRKGSPDECWPWLGGQFYNGYGSVSFYDRSYTTHSIAFFLHTGIWPSGLVIMHSCDNPPCCNPSHLSDGTTAENNRDCLDKGRGNRRGSKGEAHGHTLLSRAEVDRIRFLACLMTCEEVASLPEFKGRIKARGVNYIKNGDSWNA